MDDSAIIDTQALDRLREWGGDKLVVQMLRLFLSNSGTRMDQIRKGASDGNVDEAERGAHSLKSSAANIGAEAVRSFATRLESAACENDVEGVRQVMPALEAAYAAAMGELATIEGELAGEVGE